jgi:hypothetical protein
MTRLARSLAPLALVLGLALAPAPARAQEEAPAEAEGESKGDPLYGYVGTAFLAAGVMFVLCKSSRR